MDGQFRDEKMLVISTGLRGSSFDSGNGQDGGCGSVAV